MRQHLNELEVGGKFMNILSYNQNMAKGMEDKLFFVNILPLRESNHWVFVDFGCADGTLFTALGPILEKMGIQATLIGYDISETMVNLAKQKLASYSFDKVSVVFTYNWNIVDKYIRYSNAKKAVILSSVVHEVYSYAESEQDISTFWDRILNSGFDFICIRDMMPSESIDRPTDEDMLQDFLETIRDKKPELMDYVNDFQSHWGSLSNNKNFVHYLLKYRWITNWTREVNENYFPIYVEDFLDMMSSYRSKYIKLFRVPFLDECWLKDFGLVITDNTHIKAVFAS